MMDRSDACRMPDHRRVSVDSARAVDRVSSGGIRSHVAAISTIGSGCVLNAGVAGVAAWSVTTIAAVRAIATTVVSTSLDTGEHAHSN